MVVVAIIGGTGAVGKTLVDALNASEKHNVIVFARKVCSCAAGNRVYDLATYHRAQIPRGGSAAPVFAVDYTDVERLTKALEENNVHTVISTIVMMDPTAAKAEANFVEAAAKSSPTKRFVASNWGNASPEEE